MPTKTMTADQLAFRIMIAPLTNAERQTQLRSLAKVVRQAVGSECPSCGCEDTEDNGCSGQRLEYRCGDCDHRWGPGSES